MKRFSLIAGAMLCIAAAAMAQPQGGRMQRGEGGAMRQSFFEQLGLSDEQKTQIRQIMLDTRKKNIDIEAKLKLANIELHELMGADTPDQGKINAKISEVSLQREKMMRNHVDSRLAIQKILTPEQRKKAKELQPMMFERFREGGFRHFGGPGMMRHGGGLGPQDDMDVPELENEL
jgi:Spy/CpxP family protein refolding chaperone